MRSVIARPEHRLMSASKPGATHVMVIIEDDGIHGIVRDSDGRETPFWGWLALIAAVEAARPFHSDVGQ
jgi:hypothetical protein